MINERIEIRIFSAAKTPRSIIYSILFIATSGKGKRKSRYIRGKKSRKTITWSAIPYAPLVSDLSYLVSFAVAGQWPLEGTITVTKEGGRASKESAELGGPMRQLKLSEK